MSSTPDAAPDPSPFLREWLADQPGWSSLTGDDQERSVAVLARLAAREDVPFAAADRTLRDPDHVWLLADGTIDVFTYGARLGVRGRGRWIGLAEAITGLAGPFPASARTAFGGLRFPRAALRALVHEPGASALARILYEYAATELATGVKAVAAQEEEQASTYFPGLRGLSVQGPYRGERAVLDVFPCPLPPGRFAKVLPPEFHLAPGVTTYTLVAADMGWWKHGLYEDGHRFRYNELTALVPVRKARSVRVRAYAAYLYPGSLQATLAGREVYGTNKVPVHVHRDPGQTLVRYDGEVFARLVYEEVRPTADNRFALATVLEQLFPPGVDDGWVRSAAARIASRVRHPIAVIADAARAALANPATVIGKDFEAELLREVNDTIAALPLAGALASCTWKRVPAPACELPKSGRIPWSVDMVDVDAVVGFDFVVPRVTRLAFLKVDGEGGVLPPPLRGAHLPAAGLRVECEMGMNPGTVVRDYRSNPPRATTDPDVVDWGPAPWDPQSR